jgi:hypothetical protein
MSFDAFIAIDWSGAAPGYTGIAVARCRPGEGAPRLIKAPLGRHWTRTAVTEWLEDELAAGARLLVGFDFAFAMPHGCVDARDAFALWDLVEEVSRGEADFGASAVPRDPRLAPLYWCRGTMPETWRERRRATELACVAATGTRPETVFKLIGAKQVGKASLTGMRVLRHLRRVNQCRVTVWPFEPAPGSTNGGSVLVEIYPTLFRRHAAGTLAKLRTARDLNRALRALGSSGVRAGDYSDHDTDALISAAGMRRLCATGHAPLPVIGAIRREGWIFGVPLPPEALAA